MKVRPLRPEMVPKVEAWLDKWSKYEAYGGGTLPEGYWRYATGSLEHMAHSFEKNEFINAISKYGESLKGTPWTAYFNGDTPITKQCHDELLDATGYDDVDAHAVLLKPFFAEVDRLKELSGI